MFSKVCSIIPGVQAHEFKDSATMLRNISGELHIDVLDCPFSCGLVTFSDLDARHLLLNVFHLQLGRLAVKFRF